jgi:hypothetical protein
MKFRIETFEQQYEREKKWHLKFLWWPRRMTSDGSDVRWLETVARRSAYDDPHTDWYYKAIT